MKFPQPTRDHLGSSQSQPIFSTARLLSASWHTGNRIIWFIMLFYMSVVANSHAQSSLTLAWDRNPETNVTGYKLYWGAASGTYTNGVNVGNVTTTSVSNLAQGITYRFALTACNAQGLESDFSAEISHTTTNSLTTNLPPTLDAIANVTVSEDSGPHLVSLTGIGPGATTENQTLTIVVSSSPEWLIPTPQ